MADEHEAGVSEPLSNPLWEDWAELAEGSVGEADGMPAQGSPPRVPDTPELHLDGFDGALDLLLDLAERKRIDLSRISVVDMIDQFVAAMARYERHVKLERRADWLILAARLLQLRSRLLLPGAGEATDAARTKAGRERARLQNLQFVRAAAAWLDARPQLGRDVFTAPRRERDPRVSSYMRLMEACLAVLEREEESAQLDTEAVYRPVIPALFRIPGALARMRRQLAGLAEPLPLPEFLPRLPENVVDRDLVARSAVSSTFVAALELVRTEEAVFDHDSQFEAVTLHASTQG